MYTVIDAAGNELDLEDHQPCPPSCSLQIPLQFLDAQQRAVRNAWHDAEPEKHSTYVLRDNAGRPAGVASVAGALKVQGAYEAYCDRLSRAYLGSKGKRSLPVADATPPRPKEAEFSGTCPSCGYSRPSLPDPAVPSASAAAYAAYKQRLQSAHKHV
jgi:hypothetical protein